MTISLDAYNSNFTRYNSKNYILWRHIRSQIAEDHPIPELITFVEAMDDK